MSDSPCTPPAVPPTIPNLAPTTPMLGAMAEERVPIRTPLDAVDAVLREPRRLLFQLQQDRPGRLIGMLLLVAIACSAVYGFVVGTFSAGDQLWAAPAKIAAGLMLSGFICCPSLYIFSCLSGSRARILEVCGLLASLLCLSAVLLIGFAPVAWVFSESTNSLPFIGGLHLVFWIVAVGFGLRLLATGYTLFSARGRGGLGVWILVFLLVTLQMTTALRPIIGTADTILPVEKKFFLKHWSDELRTGRSRP